MPVLARQAVAWARYLPVMTTPQPPHPGPSYGNPYAPTDPQRQMPQRPPVAPPAPKFVSAASRLMMGFGGLVGGLAVFFLAQYLPLGRAVVDHSQSPWAVFMVASVLVLWGVGNVGWGLVLIGRRVDWLYRHHSGE